MNDFQMMGKVEIPLPTLAQGQGEMNVCHLNYFDARQNKWFHDRIENVRTVFIVGGILVVNTAEMRHVLPPGHWSGVSFGIEKVR